MCERTARLSRYLRRRREAAGYPDGDVTTHAYDKLEPRGAGFDPSAVAGIDLPGIFQVKTVPDARAIREWIAQRRATHSGMDDGLRLRAVVVGGGFIGLEMAEPGHRGFDVTLVEMLDQVLPPSAGSTPASSEAA